MTRNESVPDVSDKKPSAPRNVESTGVKSSTITLKWNPPEKCVQEIEYYEIRYKENGAKKRWKMENTESNTNEHTLVQLKGDTEYQIEVRVMTEDSEGSYSEKIMVVTNLSLANKLKDETPNLKISERMKSTHPKVYKLPVTEDIQQRDEIAKTRKCNFGMIFKLLCLKKHTSGLYQEK